MSKYVEGLADASRKLELMGQKAGAKALARAAGKATTPVVRAMRAAAPKGTRWHKTYKGRNVGPGFGSRQIARRTKFNNATGTASVSIGVRKEAFYLIQFYDTRPGRTPYTITRRRVSSGAKAVVRAHRRQLRSGEFRVVPQHQTKRAGRKLVSIKPYTLQARPWFSSVFIGAQNKMLSTFRDMLKAEIERAARGTR